MHCQKQSTKMLNNENELLSFEKNLQGKKL
jgi:hypothetical protein